MRTKGARDLRPRKQRSDRKHKYRKKHGKLVRYISKRDRNSPIKAWFWQVKPMSREGFEMWNRRIRARVYKTVFIPYIRLDVPAERLANKDVIEELAIEIIGHEGSFLLKLFSHAKNKFHCTARTVAKIKIVDSPEGLRAHVYESWRLSRYYFWTG